MADPSYFLTAAARKIETGLDRLGYRETDSKRPADACRYWATPTDVGWRMNSHWRASMSDEQWHSIGDAHLALRAPRAPRPVRQALGRPSGLGRVIELGAGGGANA